MTGKERIQRILRREPVDRIGLYEHFWPDTEKAWADTLRGQSFEDCFGLDIQESWPLNLVIDLDFCASGSSGNRRNHHLSGWQRGDHAAA